MEKPTIQTATRVIPMIYAYTTPGIAYHSGWTKIGYTEQDVTARIRQQTRTADIRWNLEWRGNAIFDDGSGIVFRDTDFHAYLRGQGFEQDAGKKNEWFHISGPESNSAFNTFRADHGILRANDAAIPYTLREEQEEAVSAAQAYRARHEGGAFLWNAKPRFGKTLAVYEFAKRIGARTVLIVTNRPAIANSWLEDYRRFLGEESGYRFVSETAALAGKRGVLTRRQFTDACTEKIWGCIEFVSLQDLKGSIYFGGQFDKLRELSDAKDERGRNLGLVWDLLVVDEAHEGVDTYKTDVAFDHIMRKFTLHLSGTPFKALASGKFASEAIFNWTYADEQKRKAAWRETEQENPYAYLPKLNLFTYKMSEIVKDELRRGIDLEGEQEAYAFDLNEFFATDANGRFKHDDAVDKFLDALTRQTRFPFATPELREELRHTFWILNRVDSAKALVRKLGEHPVFKDYAVVLAAGDGRMEDDDVAIKRSYDKVVHAITNHEKTITVSVGQLTTGITVPEWTGVLMLCSMKSPSLYMQAAFRAQNPCLFREGTVFRRKTNAYVFDFDPARTLIIFEKFANDLCSDTAAGQGDSETRKRNIGELLNFFPVIGEDEDGELVPLDAEKVLSIPRRIKSMEVVRRGFMSNFLFQNIGTVFAAPQEVLAIIQKFDAPTKADEVFAAAENARDRLALNAGGEVAVADEAVVGKVSGLFGKKIYSEGEEIGEAVAAIAENGADAVGKLKTAVKENVIREIIGKAKETYGDTMKPSDRRQIEARLSALAEREIDKAVKEVEIKRSVIEHERLEALRNRFETGKSPAAINREFEKRQEAARRDSEAQIAGLIKDLSEQAKRETVQTVETRSRERERDAIADGIRDHLRGFARTIPSFLMAYGDGNTTLKSFDTIIPDNVFREVTGITLAEFRILRDGHNLFDPVVFDDSVKEFIRKRTALANYFDESADEDIFDYIPPQRTNQIFTPRAVVRRMVDLLERENPGCFGDPEKTFVDLYMKSGMFITEIVKRLYRNPAMKAVFPDDGERIIHIFEHQVYGLAPTEIIYRIATTYILGFDTDGKIGRHNFRQLDALPYAKEGTLSRKLDECFRG